MWQPSTDWQTKSIPLLLLLLASCVGAGSPKPHTMSQVEQIKAEMNRESWIFAHMPKETPFLDTAQLSTRVVNFSKANCKSLNEAELERYVDPRIPAKIRALALNEMRHQPRCQRENFQFIDTHQQPISNTWEGYKELYAEVARWKPLCNGQFIDKDGEVLTPSMPVQPQKGKCIKR